MPDVSEFAAVIAAAFDRVTRASAHVAVVVLIVLTAQLALGRRLGARGRYALWSLVVMRALVPAMPQSGWSVFNLAPTAGATPAGRERVDATSAVSVAPVLVSLVDDRAMDAPTATAKIATASATVVSRAAAPVPIFAAIWLGGCALLGGAAVWSSLAFGRTLRRAPRVSDARVISLLKRCALEFGLRRAPAVVVVPAATGPALAGVLRPRIILPPGLFEQLDDEELRLVLAHELAHLRRRDLLVEWLLVVVRTIHWFNPLMWYAVARCRADRELACDAWLLRRRDAMRVDARSYGRTILKLAEGLPRARPLAGAVGVLEGKSSLKRRIRMIADTKARPSRGKALMTVFVAVALASCTLTDRKPPAAAAGDGTRTDAATLPTATEMRVFQIDTAGLDAEAKSRRLEDLASRVRALPLMDESRGTATTDVRTGSLIVAANAAGMPRVAALIEPWLRGRSPQVLFKTMVLALDPEASASIPLDVGGPHVVDEALTAWLKKQSARGGYQVLARPYALARPGQRVSTAVAEREQPYVKAINAVRADDGAVGYEPEMDVAVSGLSLRYAATLSPDGGFKRIQVDAGLHRIKSMRARTVGKAADGGDLSVQEPEIEGTRVETTVLLPEGKTFCIRLRGNPAWMNVKRIAPARQAELAEASDVLVLTTVPVINPKAEAEATDGAAEYFGLR